MPAQLPQHARGAEDREELDRGGQLALDHVEGAALRVGVVRVDAGAHHELALVRLATRRRARRSTYDRAEHVLVELRDERLQRMRLDRDPQAGHRREQRAVSCGDDPDPPCRDPPETRLDGEGAAVATSIPVTSQPWIRSTPRASAARA
jgi:hypothetical protein